MPGFQYPVICHIFKITSYFPFHQPYEWVEPAEDAHQFAHYVHILDLQDKSLFLPLAGKKVKKAVEYSKRVPLKVDKCEGGVILHLSDIPTDIDTVVELEIN